MNEPVRIVFANGRSGKVNYNQNAGQPQPPEENLHVLLDAGEEVVGTRSRGESAAAAQPHPPAEAKPEASILVDNPRTALNHKQVKVEENENSTKVRLMKVKEMVMQDAHHYQY